MTKPRARGGAFSVKDCPACGSETMVVDTRVAKKNGWIRRRRRCPSCGRASTTFEVLADDASWVRKHTSSIMDHLNKISQAVGSIRKMRRSEDDCPEDAAGEESVHSTSSRTTGTRGAPQRHDGDRGQLPASAARPDSYMKG